MPLKTCVGVMTTPSSRPALFALTMRVSHLSKFLIVVVLGEKMFPVVRAWQSTLDLYPISCCGLDGQDRQILGLTSQMAVSTTWGSAAEVQFMLSMSFFCWDRVFPEKEERKKV